LANSTLDSTTPVIDYEGSGYRTDFWVGQGREYEDAVERAALGQLLPARGRRIAEIGAGFGRLADLYQGYEQIVLFDYSRTLLQEAAQRWGRDARFVFVAGNVYDLPLADGVLDSLVMVRVMHHLANVPQALAQLRRVLHRESVAVLEYANKRNLKAMLRWLVGRQEWSPFAGEPVEFVKLNFDFHPAWMGKRMGEAGLEIDRQFAVSHFRLPLLKEKIPAQSLVGIEKRFFGLSGRFPVAPSVFLQATAPGSGPAQALSALPGDVAAILRCPQCGTSPLQRLADDRVVCPGCGEQYLRRDGIWDMKDAIPG